MYKLKMRINNKVLAAILPGSNLSKEEIEKRGKALFQSAFGMHIAQKKLSKREMVDGKSIRINDMSEIEYTEIPEDIPEGTEKIYDLPSLEGLTRQQLVEQEILANRKLKKIREAITEIDQQEREAIEKSLKEEIK